MKIYHRSAPARHENRRGLVLLNQIIDLELGELHDGDNTLDIQSQNTWTGEYRVGMLGLDLVLDTE